MGCGLVTQVTGIQKGRGASAPLPFNHTNIVARYARPLLRFASLMFASLRSLHKLRSAPPSSLATLDLLRAKARFWLRPFRRGEWSRLFGGANDSATPLYCGVARIVFSGTIWPWFTALPRAHPSASHALCKLVYNHIPAPASRAVPRTL